MANPLVVNVGSVAPRRALSRFAVLYVLLFGITGILLGRSFYLQVLHGIGLRAEAEDNRVALEVLTAPRGIMYDSRGTQMVENIASTDLVLDPIFLPAAEDEAPLIERLPDVLSVTPQEVRERVQQARSSLRTVVLVRALDHDTVLRVEELLPTLPGVRLNSSLVRKYLFERDLAHAVGYAAAVSGDELEEKERKLLSTDITGKTGLEKYYDELLRGNHGAIYREVDASGRPRQELGTEPATAGSDLFTTLDVQLQQYIVQLFEDRQQHQTGEEPVAGAVVALDPRNGAVRAIVSFPSYDPNIFSQPSLADNAAATVRDPAQPLYNRASDGTYAPGSTIKPLIAVAALQEHVITPNTTVQSTGGLTIGSWHFPDWKSGGHGPTNVTKALAESVNTFFYLASGGDETTQGLGPEKIAEYLSLFDWGQRTGIDLPSEGTGLVPDPAWKETTKHEAWYIGDTYHLGIGQGDVMATPLQVATSTMIVANGGTHFSPHLIEATRAPDKEPVTVKIMSRQLPVGAEHVATARAGLRQAVTEGSARNLANFPLALAGKTGTAQIGGTDKTHGWFTSFGPYETPELVVTVLLEKGGAGDIDAVPMARSIWQWWYEHRYAATPSDS